MTDGIQVDLGNVSVGVATFVIAAITLVVSLFNLQLSRRTKIADYRMKWIEDFRSCASNYYRIQYELSLVKRDISNAPQNGSRRELKEKQRMLFFELSNQKSRLLLMLNPDSDIAEERTLEGLLKSSVSSDADEARWHRKEILTLSRVIIQREWKRVRSEVEKFRKNTK